MERCQNISCQDYRWWEERLYYLVWTTDGGRNISNIIDLNPRCYLDWNVVYIRYLEKRLISDVSDRIPFGL